MLQKLKQRKEQEGFTIIEVLIVLAIAGLILLVIFLAVPALQRNSRNTQRKHDVSAILAGVNEFVTNNNGTMPTSYDGGTKALIGAGLTSAGLKLGYYDATVNSAVVDGSAANQAALPIGGADTYRIVKGAQCAAGGVTNPGSSRQVAVQYLIESTAAKAAACQDS